jgi:hypothetical protein
MSDDPDPGGPTRRGRDRVQNAEYDLLQEAARAGHVKVEITPKETPKERERRLEDESKDAELERWKDKVHLVFTIALLSIVVIGCLTIPGLPSRPESEKKWAMSALALIVGGAVGRTYGQRKGVE